MQITNVSFWPHCDGHPGCGTTSAVDAKAAGRKNRVIISAVDPDVRRTATNNQFLQVNTRNNLLNGIFVLVCAVIHGKPI
jgi:hypothetical protein